MTKTDVNSKGQKTQPCGAPVIIMTDASHEGNYITTLWKCD